MYPVKFITVNPGVDDAAVKRLVKDFANPRLIRGEVELSTDYVALILMQRRLDDLDCLRNWDEDDCCGQPFFDDAKDYIFRAKMLANPEQIYGSVKVEFEMEVEQKEQRQ